MKLSDLHRSSAYSQIQSGLTYGSVTNSELAAAAEALREACFLLSDAAVTKETIHIQVAHFEHGAFLSTQLFGFAVLDVMSDSYQGPPDPILGEPPIATSLRTPDSALSSDRPFKYALIANHPTEI